MFEVAGRYGTAKIYTDVVEQEAISQVINLLNQPFVEDAHVRMMPDIHAGAGCTVGTTMHITDKVCPNLVGVDIGCGMETTMIRETDVDMEKLDAIVHDNVPAGFAVRTSQHPMVKEDRLRQLCCRHHVDLDRALLSCGSMGGGNHFLEMDRDDDGNLYIVVHSGSRHLGLEIAKYYQEAAYKELTTHSKTEISPSTITRPEADHEPS